jgi:mannose-6-phosphate isomerase
LSEARTVLTVNPHFALEQINLVSGSVWTLNAPKETWILAIEGHAQLGVMRLSPGDVVFLEADHAEIEVGADGLKALLAYPGPDVNPDALKQRGATGADQERHDGSGDPLVAASVDHAALKQLEAPTWLL